MKVFSIAVLCAVFALVRSQESDDAITSVYRFIQGCGEKDLSYCLKMRALTFVDGALRQGDLPIADGVTLVQSEETPTQAGT